MTLIRGARNALRRNEKMQAVELALPMQLHLTADDHNFSPAD
jgi:hypothetical protein